MGQLRINGIRSEQSGNVIHIVIEVVGGGASFSGSNSPNVTSTPAPPLKVEKGVCSVCGVKLWNPEDTLCFEHTQSKNRGSG